MDRQQLLERRDQLRKRLEAIRRDIRGGLDPDLEEQAQQLENRDALIETARVAQDELTEIERQLEKSEGDED